MIQNEMETLSLLIPEYDKSFIVTEEGKLKLSCGYYGSDRNEHRFCYTLKHNSSSLKQKALGQVITISPEDNKIAYLTIPKGTKVVVKKVEIKRRQTFYGAFRKNQIMEYNYIKFDLIHPNFKGVQFKTSPRLDLVVYEKDFDSLSKLKLVQNDPS